MKKVIALIVTSCLFLITASCSYDPNTYDDTLPEGYEASAEGYEYTILSDLSSMISLCDISGDSLLSEKLRTHYAQIEEELGCVINLELTADAIESNVFRSASGASETADLIESNASTIYNLMNGGYLTALEDMPGISADDEKFGLASQRNFLSLDGKTYGIFPLYLGVSAPTCSYMLYYNDSIVSQYSSLSPEILLENGEWNRENFLEIARDVTIKDSSPTYAFITPNVEFPDFIDAALFSEGLTPAVKNEDGSYSYGYEKNKTLNVVSWLTQMVSTYRLTLDVSGTDADIYSFANGDTAFLVSSARTGFSLADSFPQESLAEDLRWISFPSNEEGSVSSFGKNDTFYGISTQSATARADSSPILDRIFSLMEGDSESTWKDRLLETYFFNEFDFSNYISSLENAGNDNLLEMSSLIDGVHEAWYLVIKGQKSAAQAHEEIESVVEGLLGAS